ncbi:hypothetical protein VNI00_008304 [Paramarasmius palmivorus]|uniref:Uncharacterized protein n=1 Tax=Paramarasmius palmivorus TaxID=297713 RepID=A0AAW0CYK2_9AGAR
MQHSGEVALPPSRPLKRSSSSVSLPTPPRTQHRRRIRRLKAPKVDSDEDGGISGGEGNTDEEENGRGRKRRRISAIQEQAEEEAFWAADSHKSSIQETLSEPDIGATTYDSDVDTGNTSDVPFLSRRRVKMSTGSAPVSPPPSHRRKKPAKTVLLKGGMALVAVPEEEAAKKTADGSPATIASTPPHTPKSQVGKGAGISPMLLRDSPSNPFLSSPESPSGVDRSSRVIQGSTIYDERPTITMVFRGVRKEFPNPHYDHKRGKPKSPDPRSQLPPEHPDYTPDLRSRPRALWPSKKRASATEEEPTTPTKPKDRAATALLKTPPMTTKRTAKEKVKPLVDSDDEDDGLDATAILPIRPMNLFGNKNKS